MSGNSSNLNLNATNQQNIVLNQQNLINRGNIIVNQTQNTQNLILNQTNIMQNSQNIILNHPSSQNIVLSQNNLLSRPPSVQNQKQSPIHPSPCQSPYQIFNTNATMVGSNNLSLISNFPQSASPFSSNFHQQSTNIIQQTSHNASSGTGLHSKNVSPNMTGNVQQSSQSVSAQMGTKLNQQQMPLSSNTSSNFASNYSNPSPISNPINSPYSNQILSPSNSVSSVSNLKSPVQSPSPILRPTTPQPQIIQQTFQQLPVMTSGSNQLVQIIQAPNNGASYQNPILNRQSIIAPTTHIQTNSSPIVKIKQPLNILPKPPPSGNPNSVGVTGGNSGGIKSNQRNTNGQGTQAIGNNQTTATPIVLPNQAILPQGQPGTLVLNQMPLLVQQNTPQGIQLVLRPGTPNSATQISSQRTQNLILQQSNTSQTPTVLIQHNSRPTTLQQVQPQQLVRVLTANGMIQQLATATPTFIAMNGQPLSLQQLSQQKSTAPQIIATNQTQQNINIQAQNMATLQACIPNLSQITQQLVQQSQQQQMTQINQTGNISTNNIIHHQQTQQMNAAASSIQLHNAAAAAAQQHAVTQNANNCAGATNSVVSSSLSGNATQIINAVATNTTNVTNALSLGGGGGGGGGGNHTSSNITANDVSHHNTTTNLNAVVKVITTPINETSNTISSSVNVSLSNSVNTSFQAPKKKPKKKKKNKETKLDLAGLMKLSGIGDDDDMYLESDTTDSSSVITSQHSTSVGNTGSVIVSEQKSYSHQMTLPKSPPVRTVNTPKQSPVQQHIQQPQQQTIECVSPSASQQQQFTTQMLNQNTLHKLQSHEFTISQSENLNLISFPSQIGSIQISAITDNSSSTNKNIHKSQQQQQVVTVQNSVTNNQNILQQHNHHHGHQQQQQGLNVVREITQNQNLSSIPTQIGNIQISQMCAAPQQSVANNVHLQNSANLTVNSNLLQHNSQGSIIVQQQNTTQQTQQQSNAINSSTPMHNIAQSLGTNLNLTGNTISSSGASQQQPPQAPLGGFKLAMSEDGRILLQHDPNLHQDLQSQLLLQQLFGLNIVPQTVHPNIVFTSNPPAASTLPHSHIITQNVTQTPPQNKTIENFQQQKFSPANVTTKTINSMQQTIATPKIENSQLLFNEPLVLAPSGINGQLMLSLSAEQLEQLKNSTNSQFSLNGPTLVINNAAQLSAAQHASQSQSQQQTLNQKPQNINQSMGTNHQSAGQQNQQNQQMQTQNVTTKHQNHQSMSIQQQQQSLINTSTKSMQTKTSTGDSVFVHNTTTSSQAQNKSNIIHASPKCAGTKNVKKVTNKTVTSSPAQTSNAITTKSSSTKCGAKTILHHEHHNVNMKANISVVVSNVSSQSAVTSIGANSMAAISSSLGINTPHYTLSHTSQHCSSGAGGVAAATGTTGINQLQDNLQTSMPSTNVSSMSIISSPTIYSTIGISSAASVKNVTDTLSNVVANSSAGLNMPQLVPIPPSSAAAGTILGGVSSQGPFQRVQTIQLTPQKQQQLKNVQFQIQALSSRLQSKTLSTDSTNKNSDSMMSSDNEIHEIQLTLQRLFNEQQKILATGKLLPSLPAQALPVFSTPNNIICSNKITNTSSTESTQTINTCNNIPYSIPEPVQQMLPTSSTTTPATKTTNQNHFSPNLISQHSPISRNSLTPLQQPSPQEHTQTSPPKVYYHHMNHQPVIQVNTSNTTSTHCQQHQPQLIPSSVQSHASMTTTTSSANTSIITSSHNIATSCSSSSIPTSLQHSKTTTNTSHLQSSVVSSKSLNVSVMVQQQTQLPEKATQIGTSQTHETCVPPKFVSPNSLNSNTNSTSISNTNTSTTMTTTTTVTTTTNNNNINSNNLNQKHQTVSPNARTLKKTTPTGTCQRPAISRSALFEQQLSMDQQEAANPDIHTPFASKADACKRLVRYHCFNQPVLSQKDLNKADEIFELTARHFIDKFYNMINKYRTLRLMESMREVPTSELMMIDRMFIAGEQQELEKLRAEKLQRDLEGTGCDISIANLIKHEDSQQQLMSSDISTGGNGSVLKTESKADVLGEFKTDSDTFKQEIKSEMSENNSEYDEWLCIQKELGYVTDKTSTTKMEVKIEAKCDVELDIESNIKTFEIRSCDNKRSLNEQHFNDSSKRVCTSERTRHHSGGGVGGTITGYDDNFVGDVDDTKVTMASPHVDLNSTNKHLISESEVYRTQTSHYKQRTQSGVGAGAGGAGVGGAVTTVPSSNNQITQSKLVTTSSEIDLELELGFDQLGGINLLKTNHLECSFDENIDAQVQSAIDSILNLQQNQDGSINMNAIITNTSTTTSSSATATAVAAAAAAAAVTSIGGAINQTSSHSTNVDDKSTQFINDLLGVPSSNHLGTKKSDVLRKQRTLDKINENNQLYDDLTCDDEPTAHDRIYRSSSSPLTKPTNVNRDTTTTVDSFSECSSPDDALDQAVRSILS